MQQPQEIRLFPEKKRLFGLVLSLTLWACGDEEPVASAAQSVLPEAESRAQPCHDGANLKLQIAGAVAGNLNWHGEEFQCESMRRPGDAGARLRFVGDIEESTLALIVAIPNLARGATAKELASNLTLYFEGNALFFGTQGTESCWADIVKQDLLDAARYDIAGEVYCIAPLSEINGGSSVTVVELSFATRLDWDMT